MIHTLYVEHEVLDHPRTQEILRRFSNIPRVDCDRYTEIFNLKNQNFRLQKIRPALILARKFGKRVLPTPAGYGIGGKHNYYFSHMLNCIYDCRYCFLQGMYRSAHYVLFVNYDDFSTSIDSTLHDHGTEDVWFFSGYDCDSLALDPVTGFTSHLLPFLESRPRAFVELRTKSTQIRTLLSNPALPNLVVAFSLTPSETVARFDYKTPSLEKRLQAMRQLANKGWPLGVRFDPLIWDDGFESRYQKLFQQVFEAVSPDALHSVTVGPFRMPQRFFRTVRRLYPDEPLFAGTFYDHDTMISYPVSRQEEMTNFCRRELTKYIRPEILFSCFPDTRTQLNYAASQTSVT